MENKDKQTFALDQWPRLSDSARIKARHTAERNIKARYPRPERKDYTEASISRYSPQFVGRVNRGVWIALMASFIPSALRLFIIGASTFNDTLDAYHLPYVLSLALSILVGVCVVIMAETGQVIFSLAFATSTDHKSPLWIGLILSTLIALTGNFYVGLWRVDRITLFICLETLAPPIVVMSLAYVQKNHVLAAEEMRHQNEATYQRAISEWDRDFRDIERHPEWRHFLARALRDVYTRTYAKRLSQTSIPDDGWNELVLREMNTDEWFQDGSNGIPVESTGTHNRSKGGLIDQADSSGTAAERVKWVLHEHPELLDMKRIDAAREIGVSIGSLQRGIDLYRANGFHTE